MPEFSGFTPREAPELPDDPNSGSLSIAGGGSFGSLVVSGTSTLSVVSAGVTVGLGTTSAPSNSQLTFELTSDTNLRIKVRGSDGVLRSANITLA
jgi:hypothetical protein